MRCSRAGKSEHLQLEDVEWMYQTVGWDGLHPCNTGVCTVHLMLTAVEVAFDGRKRHGGEALLLRWQTQLSCHVSLGRSPHQATSGRPQQLHQPLSPCIHKPYLRSLMSGGLCSRRACKTVSNTNCTKSKSCSSPLVLMGSFCHLQAPRQFKIV